MTMNRWGKQALVLSCLIAFVFTALAYADCEATFNGGPLRWVSFNAAPGAPTYFIPENLSPQQANRVRVPFTIQTDPLGLKPDLALPEFYVEWRKVRTVDGDVQTTRFMIEVVLGRVLDSGDSGKEEHSVGALVLSPIQKRSGLKVVWNSNGRDFTDLLKNWGVPAEKIDDIFPELVSRLHQVMDNYIFLTMLTFPKPIMISP